jgi:hypothetical protein
MKHVDVHREFIAAIERLMASTKSIAGTSLEANTHFEKLIAGMRNATVEPGEAEPRFVEILSRFRNTADVVETLSRGLQGVLEGLIKDAPVLN